MRIILTAGFTCLKTVVAETPTEVLLSPPGLQEAELGYICSAAVFFEKKVFLNYFQ